MKKGIAVAGNMIMDIIKSISRFPERHGLVRIEDKAFSVGGAVCNTGRDLAAMAPDTPIRLVGIVGEDGEGDEIIRQLSQYPNIDMSRVLRQGQTSFTDVLSEIDTKARSFMVFGGASDVFDCCHVDVENLDCDLFHIGYILLLGTLDKEDPEYGTHMARLLHMVQQQGIKTSVDVVSEVGDRYKRLVPPALKYTDYFIVNEIEAGKTAGIDLRGENEELLVDRIPQVLSRLKEMGVKEWVVIHAPEGGFGLDSQGQYVKLGSLKLPEGYIKGTVGAGDAFCAGVLYAAYNGDSLEQGIRDGIAAAAMSLAEPGASEAMKPIAQVRVLYDSLPKREV